MNISAKKLAAACISGVAVLALICVGARVLFPTELDISASMEETPDGIKVFIGDVDRAQEAYIQHRTSDIEKLAESIPDSTMDAVIGFDDYYAVNKIDAWAQDYNITINRVYMWPRSETGRLSLYVENNDIKSCVEEYKQWLKENGYDEDEQYAEKFRKLMNGEYGVFALAISATAETLETLNTEADCVSYVDVMYNAEVEKYAKKAGKAVSYIELPAKPDGAL